METSFGKKLRNARINANLTQEQLAEKIGCSRALINHYESDLKEPRLKTLRAIIEVLNIKPDYLLLDGDIRVYNNFNATRPINSENMSDYYHVIKEAADANVTPEDIQQFIQLIKNAKQKAR